MGSQERRLKEQKPATWEDRAPRFSSLTSEDTWAEVCAQGHCACQQHGQGQPCFCRKVEDKGPGARSVGISLGTSGSHKEVRQNEEQAETPCGLRTATTTLSR